MSGPIVIFGGEEPRNEHGLTMMETLRQSFLIHPDWNLEMHISYLKNDAFFDADYVAVHEEEIENALLFWKIEP